MASLILTVDDFLLVKSPDLKVTCISNEALSFGVDDITKISSKEIVHLYNFVKQRNIMNY